MGHQFLKEANLPKPFFEEKTKDKRSKSWKQDKKKYNVDPREVWDLDTTFYYWLYEHLKMYLMKAEPVVDLMYHKFTYNNQDYTQLELIDWMIHNLEYMLSDKINSCLKNQEAKYKEKAKEVAEIWALILPSMWY